MSWIIEPLTSIHSTRGLASSTVNILLDSEQMVYSFVITSLSDMMKKHRMTSEESCAAISQEAGMLFPGACSRCADLDRFFTDAIAVNVVVRVQCHVIYDILNFFVSIMSVEGPRKILHSKRSFGKYPKAIDSPAYDAYVLSYIG